MSNAATGLWSGLGALLGGVAGAFAGKYVAQARPRYTYTEDRGHEIEDAMVAGGAAGAVLGAFIGGAAAGEGSPPASSQLPPK